MLPSVALERLHHLVRIFELGDVDSLRDEMNQASCIISGSAALYLFHTDTFIPNDLDFYCPDSSAPDFQYVLFQRGYVHVTNETRESEYPPATIAAVLRYRKPGVERSINLVTTIGENPFSAVVQFHSTLVMNAITGDGVICLYPMLTLSGHGVVAVNTPSALRCIDKYIQRGFRFSRSFRPHRCQLATYCRQKVRSINGEHVLAIPFAHDKAAVHVIRRFVPFRWRLPELLSTNITST